MKNTSTLPAPALTLQRGQKVTRDQLHSLGFTDQEIEAGESRGEMKTRGPWQVAVSYRALVEQIDFETGQACFWPARTLADLRQNGYAMDGRVSLGGVKRSAFTSSYFFEVDGGGYFEAASIFVRH